jgi:hypothetical protein
MNAAHWHLAMNHIPVVGGFFVTCLLAVALWRKSDELIRVALGALVVVAVLTLPVYLTGEPADVVIMDLPEYSDVLVKAHEQAATIAFSAMVVVGFAALGGLIVYRKTVALPRWLAAAIFGLSLVTSGGLAWTANLGGRIHHPEVRPAGATK